MSQLADSAPVDHDAIDLDVVREMLSHFTFNDYEEAQELILSALQEINEHFGWVSLEAAKVVADHFNTTDNRVFGLLTFYADFRTEPRGLSHPAPRPALHAALSRHVLLRQWIAKAGR